MVSYSFKLVHRPSMFFFAGSVTSFLETTLAASLPCGVKNLGCKPKHTVDERNPAPPKKSCNDDPLEKPTNHGFNHGFKVV